MTRLKRLLNMGCAPGDMGACLPSPSPQDAVSPTEFTVRVQPDLYAENLMWHRRVRELQACIEHTESILRQERHPEVSDMLRSHTVPPAPMELLQRQASQSTLRAETEHLKSIVAELQVRSCLLNGVLITVLYAPEDSAEYQGVLQALHDREFFEDPPTPRN